MENRPKKLYLQQARDKKYISLRVLADEIGVNYTTLSLWERGLRNPSFHNQQKLEKYFGESIETLLKEVD